jgi:hypothetical protein
MSNLSLSFSLSLFLSFSLYLYLYTVREAHTTSNARLHGDQPMSSSASDRVTGFGFKEEAMDDALAS